MLGRCWSSSSTGLFLLSRALLTQSTGLTAAGSQLRTATVSTLAQQHQHDATQRTFHSAAQCLNTNAPPAAAAAAAPKPATPSPPPPPPPPSPPIPAGHFRLTIDGKPIDVPSNYAAIQACEMAGVYIPRFCYHDRLAVAGNCRMCLVEVEKVPKPVASCAYPIGPNMVIKTNTPMVKKAREGVMEMLLANHPLDCFICDQAGECDLQNQSLHYGSDLSRFREVKRGVEDKYLGPVVKTVMTRCIHCTRCVRFTSEVAGITDLGTTGRGQSTEIGTYVSKVIDSELSGNVVDLCPVGALTSKPYAFKSRPRELKSTPSIDILDATHPSIRIDSRGPEILRILPRLNEEINEEWISDKSRYAFEGLKRQRLDMPLIKRQGQYVPITWPEALSIASSKLLETTPAEILAVAGDLADSESLITLKDFWNRLGSTNHIHQQAAARLPADLRSQYLFNTPILALEQADYVLLVGTNPRMESPLIASRIRKVVRNNRVPVVSIGPEAHLNISHKHLGDNAQILSEIAAGTHPVSAQLKNAKKPVVIVGISALQRSDAAAIYSSIQSLRKVAPNLVQNEGKTWNGINVLHTQSSRVAALDVGFVPGPNALQKKAKFVYLLNSDDFDASLFASDAFIVYQGHHGDRGAAAADLILPAPAYTEKNSVWVNVEGRPQYSWPATAALSNARVDWKIIRALSEVSGVPLPYNTVEDVRARLEDVAPHFSQLDTVQKVVDVESASSSSSSSSSIESTGFNQLLENFFFTDVISRNSKIMVQCSQELPQSRNSYKNPKVKVEYQRTSGSSSEKYGQKISATH